MPRYDFQSPGEQANKALEEALTRQRLARHQALMDQIAVQNAKSEEAYRQQQATSLAEQRAAVAEWRKAQAQAAGDKAKQHNAFTKAVAEFDPTSAGLSPQQLAAYNFIKQTGDEGEVKAFI